MGILRAREIQSFNLNPMMIILEEEDNKHTESVVHAAKRRNKHQD